MPGVLHSTRPERFWASSGGFRRIKRRERYDDVSALDPASVHHCCGIRLRGGDGILGDLRSIELISPQPYREQTIQRASPGAYGGRGLTPDVRTSDSHVAENRHVFWPGRRENHRSERVAAEIVRTSLQYFLPVTVANRHSRVRTLVRTAAKPITSPCDSHHSIPLSRCPTLKSYSCSWRFHGCGSDRGPNKTQHS